jgi:hypothetical protein
MTSLVDVYRSMGGGWLDVADLETANETRLSKKDGS